MFHDTRIPMLRVCSNSSHLPLLYLPSGPFALPQSIVRRRLQIFSTCHKDIIVRPFVRPTERPKIED